MKLQISSSQITPKGQFLIALFVAVILLSLPAQAVDLVNYSLTDIRVLYLTDNIDEIDWPTIYYLNDRYGSHIDIAVIQKRSRFRVERSTLEDREIDLLRCYIADATTARLDSLATELFIHRRPDLILFDGSDQNKLYSAIEDFLTTISASDSLQFNIIRIFESANRPDSVTRLLYPQQVVYNATELREKYRERMEIEIPRLIGEITVDQSKQFSQLRRYTLIKDLSATGDQKAGSSVDFLSTIPANRLISVIDGLLLDGPKKITLSRFARQYLDGFRASRTTTGKDRVNRLIEAYRAIFDLSNQFRKDPTFRSKWDIPGYMERMVLRAERAALQAVGIRWNGQVIRRDSPHGPRIKFRASLSADGPKEVQLKAVRFHPYWDTTIVALDTISRSVTPHQSLVREYSVDIDKTLLESHNPDSLVFTADLQYGTMPLTVRHTLPVWIAPDVHIKFEPEFYFVPPPASLDVDRVVSNSALRVVITKPKSFSGKVKLDLETPRGMFAGAYRQELTLEKDKVYEVVRIGFSTSKLFELGLQRQFVSLSYENRVVAKDTGLIRIASCRIADTLTIGFLPDSSGWLEDFLSMTDARFRPLTDRGLLTGDLSAYNVLIIGYAAFRNYPSLVRTKDRLEEFVRDGGSLVIMSQPEDWPEGLLPVSFVPSPEIVEKSEIEYLIKSARILSKPYDITVSKLLSEFNRKRDVAAAAIAPAEQIFVTPTGATLLSISRIGMGQIIYCGLPIEEMVSKLDIDAIHLFANILNY